MGLIALQLWELQSRFQANKQQGSARDYIGLHCGSKVTSRMLNEWMNSFQQWFVAFCLNQNSNILS